MRLNQDFELIKRVDSYIPYDYYISKFPIVLFKEKPKIKSGKKVSLELYKNSFVNALNFCEYLNKRSKPKIKNSNSTSFRLPTEQEWEYAAKGWSETKKAQYLILQKKHYKIPFIDFPVTETQTFHFNNGYSATNELFENELGLYGMLGYAKEWCCTLDYQKNIQKEGKLISWEEYYTNYNNDISYKTNTQSIANSELHVFRVVLPCKLST